MGKDFGRELRKLDLVTQTAAKADITDIQTFLQKHRNRVLYAVGSGGSFSVAKVFELFCYKAGWTAITTSPLGLQDIPDQIRKAAFVLFSASGKNNDIKNAYRFLSMIEPYGILSLCMREDSPLKGLQRDNLHNQYFEYQMPVKKDGYLAVESLISSTILLTKSFSAVTENPFFHFAPEHSWGKKFFCDELLESVLERETIIVLHAGITSPAAIDLESKFSETALGNIQLVDYRSFAHGRHFWLSSRKERTGIVALYGESDSCLAERTMSYIPENIPVVRICVQDSNMEGLLDAMDAVFQIVERAGAILQVNPGKPHVEEFGKKLYHLNYDIYKYSKLNKINKSKAESAAFRKVGLSDAYLWEKYREAAQRQLKTYRKKGFAGVVFDYDGTLHCGGNGSTTELSIRNRLNELLEQGLMIGIATGRGKSIRTEMMEWVRPELWSKVTIAYYNGGVTGCLDDVCQPNKNVPIPKPLEELRERIFYNSDMDLINHIDGIKDRNPYQLTFTENGNTHSTAMRMTLKALLEGIEGLRVMESDHSIDIVPASSSKNNIFRVYQEQGLEMDQFLKIGDSGIQGGNDFDLLNHLFSISVDTVSDRIDNCWNFAPLGMRNLEATFYYLTKLKKRPDGMFSLEMGII